MELATQIDIRVEVTGLPLAVVAITHDALIAVAEESARGFAEAGAASCDVTIGASDDVGSLSITAPASLSVERLDAIRQAGEQANCSVSIARSEDGDAITLGFEAIAAPPVTTFTLSEHEPEVVEINDAELGPPLPATATTFTLPDGEPVVVEAGQDLAPVPPTDDADLPKVVLIEALSEIIGFDEEPAEDAATPADDATGDGGGTRDASDDAA
jgi:hypothetical protein